MTLHKDKVFKAADSYIRSGKIEKAVAEYEKWVGENPTDWNTIRQIGDLYARIGRNQEAIQKYTQIAEFYRKDGFNVRAIATYKMILRLDPQHEQAMRHLAELQVAQGLFMEAKAQFQALVEIYGKSGQKRKALDVFKKLAEIDPADLKVRYKYAEFLDREGKVGEAVSEYTSIADEFINKGLVNEACQILEKGLRIDGKSKLLRSKMSHAACLQGDYAKGIKLIEEIKDQHPRDVDLLTGLGDAYMGASKTAEAGAIFRRLAEIEPDNPQHAMRLAELAIVKGQFDQALELIAPAVNQLVARREGERAAQVLQKILAREPRHTKTLLKLVEVYTVLQQDSGRISAYDQLCEAYTQLGEFDRAADVAQQLIELEPENFQHRDRLRFLRARKGGAKGAPPAATPMPEVGDFDPLDASAPDVESRPAARARSRPAAAPAQREPRTEEEVGAIAKLSPEDEEHIREKFTEAEVFVRYGLVEKAIDQLKDLLESFPFHAGSREKLIEVYTDQGMNREAGEHMLELSRIYQRAGDAERASQLRDQAVELHPELAEAAAAAAGAGEEEMELLEPQGESEFGEELDLLTTTNSGMSLASAVAEPPIGFEPAEPPDSEDSVEDDEIPIAIEDEEEAEEEEPAAAASGVPSESEFGIEVESEERPVDVSSEDELSIPFALDDDEPIEDRTLKLPYLEARARAPSPPETPVDEDEDQIDISIETSSPSVDVPSDPLRGVSRPPVQVQPAKPDKAPAAPAPPPRRPLGGAFRDKAASLSSTPEPATAPIPVKPAPAPVDRPVDKADRFDRASEIPELLEVDECVAFGLFDDARDTLAELLKTRPGDPRVLAKIEELGFSFAQLEPKTSGAHAFEGDISVPKHATSEPSVEFDVPFESIETLPQEEEPISSVHDLPAAAPQSKTYAPRMSEDDVLVDLASELSEEMFGTQSAVEEARPSSGPLTDSNLEEIFREFKKGVEKQLGSEDYDTRYNLGIAYKEMGLLDEAIAEFQLASKDVGRLLECCSMLGLCFMEKGMPDIAIKWFEKGLKAPGRSEEEYHGLRYDLAQAHEAAGDAERALELYMEIYRVNNKFRDVRHRVRELQAAKK